MAKLEKEGCPIVAAPRYDTVTGNSRMQRLGDGVKVTLRQHRKQPCHAAFITSRGEVAYVCTDRGRHAGEAGSGVLDLKAVEREKGFEPSTLTLARYASNSVFGRGRHRP